MQQHCLDNIVVRGIRHRAGFAALAAILACGAACREESPPERFDRNLGTAERPLLPTAKPSFDESLYKDRADGIEPLAEQEDTGSPDAQEESHEADLELIAELIDAVRTANREKDFEGLSELLVERQRDVMTGAAAALTDAATAAESFIAAVEPIDPQPVFAAMMLPALRAELEFPVRVEDVTFDSDTEASAPLANATIGFEKVGEEWFVSTDDLEETAEEESRQAGLAKQALEDATQVVGDTALSAADRDAQVMVIFQKLAAAIASPPD